MSYNEHSFSFTHKKELKKEKTKRRRETVANESGLCLFDDLHLHYNYEALPFFRLITFNLCFLLELHFGCSVAWNDFFCFSLFVVGRFFLLVSLHPAGKSFLLHKANCSRRTCTPFLSFVCANIAHHFQHSWNTCCECVSVALFRLTFAFAANSFNIRQLLNTSIRMRMNHRFFFIFYSFNAFEKANKKRCRSSNDCTHKHDRIHARTTPNEISSFRFDLQIALATITIFVPFFFSLFFCHCFCIWICDCRAIFKKKDFKLKRARKRKSGENPSTDDVMASCLRQFIRAFGSR